MVQQQDIVAQVEGASNADVVLEAFNRLTTYDEATRWRLLSSGFHRLSKLDYPLTIDWAFELCFASSERDRFWAQHEISSWLNRLPFEQHHTKLQWIGAFAGEVANSTDLQRRLISVLMLQWIGTRDEQAVKQLEQVAGIYAPSLEVPELQEYALRTLAWLGYEDADALTNCIVSYFNDTDNPGVPIVQAASTLASPLFISVLKTHLQTHKADATFVEHAAHALADIAYHHPSVADEAWAALVTNMNDTVASVLDFWGDVSSRFNSEHVINVYLKRLTQTDANIRQNWGESPNDRIYDRMQALTWPKQVRSFHVAGKQANARVIEIIRDDACSDTNNGGYAESLPTRLKRVSWDVALRLNIEGVKNWFPDAFEEKSRFTQQELCTLAGYIRADSAISCLRQLVGSSTTQISLGIAALKALGCYGSSEALELLLKSCVNHDGNIPLNLRDALSQVCYDLGDCFPLVQHLTDPHEDPNTRLACAAALELYGAMRPEQATLHQKDLLEQARQWAEHTDDKITCISLNYLISAIGFLDIDENAGEFLASLVSKSGVDQERVCEALARCGFLANKPDLMQKIGLVRREDEWVIEGAVGYRSAFIITLLYHHAPLTFAAVIVSLIAPHRFYSEVVQVLQVLGRPGISTLPVVEDAVMKRIREINDVRQSETDAVEALARMSPERLAREITFSDCNEWYWPAREALAYCLQKAGKHDGARPFAVATLKELLTDNVYTVRRYAARALSELDPVTLHQSCLELLQNPNPLYRQFSADMGHWVPDEEQYQKLHWQVTHDTEAKVRIRAIRAHEYRVERTQAEEYLQRTLEVQGDDVLSVWVYGQALRNVGDDTTARRLRKAARNAKYPANVRFWFASLVSAIEDRWKKLMDKRNNENDPFEEL